MKDLEILASSGRELYELAATIEDAFLDDCILYGEPPYGPDSVKEISERIEERICYTFVRRGVIIGGMYLKCIDENDYRLKRIWIDKKNQNEGLGTEILKLIEEMIGSGNKITLDTPYKSYRNHHFYEKNGFIKIGEKRIQKNDGKLDPEFTLFEYMKIIEKDV